MGKVQIICAWHKQNFGFELVMREEDWEGQEGGQSHGLCEECEKKEMTKVKTEEEKGNEKTNG